MTPDPHLQVPDHPQTPDGQRVYDPGCWMCRDITAQPMPGWLQGALERVAGPLNDYLDGSGS